ncbi:MAG TPA: DNA-binding response regulator [Erysipelotrichaceae bacterium]|nr:DNA-binding response regulator [Erysipelotrichaceae bacterium]
MIYIVEDDEDIQQIELYTLQNTGFEAKGFSDGAAFWAAMQTNKPDLVILDVMLPDEDGVQILKKLKGDTQTAGIPVIFASAKGTEFDKIKGLDLGADDYLVKPFGMMEMVSRVKAVMRRSSAPVSQAPVSGPIEIRLDQHKVFVYGKEVELTLKEFELLNLLLSHPGIVFTREQMLEQIWGFLYDGETRTVDVHIGTLRQKLGEAGKQIETVRGVGYRYRK